jgi:hypothetical protein
VVTPAKGSHSGDRLFLGQGANLREYTSFRGTAHSVFCHIVPSQVWNIRCIRMPDTSSAFEDIVQCVTAATPHIDFSTMNGECRMPKKRIIKSIRIVTGNVMSGDSHHSVASAPLHIRRNSSRDPLKQLDLPLLQIGELLSHAPSFGFRKTGPNAIGLCQ